MFDGISGALKVFWDVTVALWQIPDGRQLIILSGVNVVIAIIQIAVHIPKETVGKIFASLELAFIAASFINF